MSWDYGKLATEIYELDKPIGHSFGDVEYYARHLAGITGPILEPATGTGRVLIPLLEQGLHAEGLDSSPHMLAVCRQHAQDRGLSPVLREANMTTFRSPGAYRAIIRRAADRGRPGGPPDQRTRSPCGTGGATRSYGGLAATELQLFRLQHWSLPEFRPLLTSAGFTAITVTTGYQDHQRPGPRSTSWTFHAIRG